MIDYRTAHAIFASKSNARIDHCNSQCHLGLLQICHHEERYFRSDPLLCDSFITDTCILEPDDDIYGRCLGVANSPNGKALLKGNDTAVFMTASALSRHLGIISDHKSSKFATVHDLCQKFGVHVMTAHKYFSLLWPP